MAGTRKNNKRRNDGEDGRSGRNIGTDKEAEARRSQSIWEEENMARGRKPGSSTDAPEDKAAKAEQEDARKEAKKQRKGNASESTKRIGERRYKGRREPRGERRKKRKQGKPKQEANRRQDPRGKKEQVTKP